MLIAANIKKMLDSHHISYRTIDHEQTASLVGCVDEAGIGRDEILSAEVLADSLGTLLVIVPLTKKIDFAQLKAKLRRNLRVVPEGQANSIFNDCEPGVRPPFGRPYGIDLIIDSSITAQDSVYFQAGSFTSLLQISTDDYLYLNGGAQVFPIAGSERVFNKKSLPNTEQQTSYDELVKLFKLPSLSNVARKILQLNLAKNSSISELAHIISTDPTIQDQILSFARLPFWSASENSTLREQNEDENVQHVIKHVLGFDRVSHIALGVSAGGAFSGQDHLNNIDLHSFWSHSLCCAALAEAIANKVAINNRLVKPYISYISGLLHNIGGLLFNELFPLEFGLLKKWLKLNPKVPITLLENKLIAMKPELHMLRGGHAQLGAWLLKFWEMPEEAYVVAKEHHHPNYVGKHDHYVRIVWLANRILKKNYDIGDGTSGNISSEYLSSVGISAAELDTIVVDVMSKAGELSNLAIALVSTTI